MRQFEIRPVDCGVEAAIDAKIDNLNKPKHSLGLLEKLAKQICLVQQTLSPHLDHPCHLLLGGDHGIEREGVSVSPREVTWQQMINFTRGGGGVNMFCRQHGFDLSIVDVGVDHDLSGVEGIIDRKIARGTRNFLHEAAMSEEELERSLNIGAELVDDCIAKGCNILSLGEMGVGNTSASSIWMSEFGDIPLIECIGAGAGLDAAGIEHKTNVLICAVARYHAALWEKNDDTEDMEKDEETELAEEMASIWHCIRYFGGFEMTTAIGAMLRAAERGILIMVDGFIMTAAMLASALLYPDVLDYAIFCHCGDESGHAKMLAMMNAKPLLRLGLRLGEGTGALCAYPIIESSVRMMNEMNDFDHAHITKYF